MKGLIFRELYLGKNNTLVVLCISFVMGIIGILVRLSMKIGNLTMLPEETLAEIDLSTYLIFSLTICTMLLMCNSMVAEVAGYDHRSKWMNFQYSAPINEEKYVFVKYLVMLATTAAAFVPSLINAVIIGALSNRPLDFGIISVITVIACFTIIFTVFQTALIYLFHSVEKAMYVFISLVIAAFLILGINIAEIKDLYEHEVDILRYLTDIMFSFCEKYMLAAVIAAVVFIIAGYFLTVAFMKRRLK